MARRGSFIGKLGTGDYEVGRDPAAFHKQRGFPYSQSVVELSPHFVERVWKVPDMKPGDVRRVFRRAKGIYIRELTPAERKKLL